jgi:hypothetical protein
VYGSTVACIPFLFEPASWEGPADSAALVRLLCSIGGDGEEKPDPEEVGGLFEGEEEDAASGRSWTPGRGCARADVFLGLLTDPDQQGRAAAAAA